MRKAQENTSSGGLETPDTKSSIRKVTSFQRRAELILQAAHQCEIAWDDPNQRMVTLYNLRKLVQDCQAPEAPPLFSHLLRLINSGADWNTRQLTDFMVPIERYLDKNVHDGHIFTIRHEDAKPHGSTSSMPLILILDHLRSAFNVGSILRSADCLGVQQIYLCGYTPLPSDRRVERAALGSQEYVEWRHCERTEDAIAEVRGRKISLHALETVDGGDNIFSVSLPQPVALILGNERFGVGHKILRMCDGIVQVPTFGQKNSLNVAACMTTVGFELRRQWGLTQNPRL